MSSKRASYLLRKTIWTPKTLDNDPFLPGAPATLHAKAEVTLSEAGGLPHGQPNRLLKKAGLDAVSRT
ncbi:hypothetical protein [Limimaricola soesokkakensis]|uniref:hypothetical protein n=1 Tax=Limimaricola soesokkakensis TaxID=1343159 RepID=UPI0035198F64